MKRSTLFLCIAVLPLSTILFGLATRSSAEPATHPATQPSRVEGQGNPALAGRLQPILHRLDDKSAIVAARVVDLATGQELFSENADRPMTPASNQKLAVTAAALDRLGPDYPFKTTLAIDGDDLWLVGGGDPSTGDPVIAKAAGEKPTTILDRFASDLAKLGVTHIKGNLYYFDGTFDDQHIHPTWHRSYLTDWYAAPISGLNFNDNCIDVAVEPTRSGELTTFTVIPPTDGVKIVNQIKTGKETKPEISRELDADDFTLTGSISEKKELESKAITDPGHFFADALRHNLKQHGIAIDGQIVRAAKQVDLTQLSKSRRVVSVNTTPLRVILRRLNKNSQNLFAEALAKTLARTKPDASGQPGSWEAGGKVVYEFLRQNGVDTDPYKFIDGSGLSEDNKLTARGQTQLLLAMEKHRDHEVYRESLPVCGKDGTLAKRMKDITGCVLAKTGSLNSVRALSGYATTHQGKRLVFSLLLNHVAGNTKAAEGIEDDFCRALVGWSE